MLNGIQVFLKKTSKKKQFWPLLFIGTTYIILGYRFFAFILKYSVNIPSWDQWDVVNDILFEKNILKIFLTQHNEHRIGTGLLLMKLLAYFSHWNNIVEMLAVGVLIFISSVIALLIKKRLSNKIEIYDLIIPFIFLNFYQAENLTWGFQIAFVLPLFFLIFALYLITFKNSIKRNIFLIILVLLSTYSSFHGIFLSGIIGVFFLMSYFTNSKKQTKNLFLLYIFFTVLIAMSYFIGYQRASHLDKLIKKTHIQSYLQYINFQINAFIGNYSFNLYYYLIPLGGLYSFVINLINLVKSKFRVSYFVIFGLFTFSIAFTLSTAYGRVVISIFQSQSSRYVTLLIPFYYATYLTLVFSKSNFRNSFIMFIVLFYVYFSSQNMRLIYDKITKSSEQLASWKKCYLDYEDIKKCNLKCHTSVYHDNVQSNTRIKVEFDLLKKNSLNIYSK